MNLADVFSASAKANPAAPALVLQGRVTTYGELDALANRVARFFEANGVRRGDRVAIWLEKGPLAIASMQAAMRLGAAYVPIDPLAPAVRAATIANDCDVRVVVTSGVRYLTWKSEGPIRPSTRVLLADESHAARDGETVLTIADARAFDDAPIERPECAEDELAYILYTSGSTGTPKGVCLSHGNAYAFVNWCFESFSPTSADVFSSHAPFHFDLSVCDLYVAFMAGARVVLIPDTDAFVPEALVDVLAREKITVWYSVPSVLVLMMQLAPALTEAAKSLRVLLFAGEPFPTTQLRRLREIAPHPVYWNLFGPTETNVCTAHRVDSLDADATTISIGLPASGDRCWIAREDGTEAAEGEMGELIVDGPTVMLGYWGRDRTFGKPYPTGDLVRRDAEGRYWYHGRKDAMLKVRGHRIEPREVESVLELHPSVERAGAYKRGDGTASKLCAAVVVRPNHKAPTLLELKRLCAERLPRSMIIDALTAIESMPVTRNGKVDRRALEAL
jgi:amino acid adenylation domain-containing protein